MVNGKLKLERHTNRQEDDEEAKGWHFDAEIVATTKPQGGLAEVAELVR